MNRTSTYLAALVGLICGYFFVSTFSVARPRTVRNDVVQGILIGGGLAFVTAQVFARVKARKINGWITMFGCGVPGNGMFWSLTMGDARNRFVPNLLNRYSVSDRSRLAQNPDGSLNIYIQNTAPAGHESNWLPAPMGHFILWLRVYVPGQAILDGKYEVPPVVKAK